MSLFKRSPPIPTVIPWDGIPVDRWSNITLDLHLAPFTNNPEERAKTMGKWQAVIDYLVSGGELYVLYNSETQMKGSIGKVVFEGDVKDIKDLINFGSYDVSIKPVFKIVFEETKSHDFIKLSRYGNIETDRNSYNIGLTTDTPEHYYLTTSSFYRKKVEKAHIVHDRYGNQITEGCYVFASLPGKPPSIEAGKITKVTDAGIIWFKKIGQDHIIKGLLRSQSCVVITEDLISNVLLEKLST